MKKQGLKQDIDNFLNQLEEEGKSKNTIKQYRNGLKTFLDFMTENNLDEVNLKTINKYKKYLDSLVDLEDGQQQEQKQKIKLTTYNAKAIAFNIYIKHLFSHLDEKELKKKYLIHVQNIDSFKACLSVQDYDNLLKCAYYTNYKMYLYIKLTAQTGLRVSEASKIKAGQIRNNKKIRIKGKGKKFRDILIDEELRNELLKYIEDNNLQNDNYIFHGYKFETIDGKRKRVPNYEKPLDRIVIWRNLKSIAKKAGVDSELISPHLLRHRYALSYLENNGGDMKALINLSRLLGHSKIDTTKLYLSLSDEELEASNSNLYKNSETWRP